MNSIAAQVLAAHQADPNTFVSDDKGVFTGTVPAEDALAIWQALREQFPRSGLWPIIRGDFTPDHDFDGDSDEKDPSISAPKGTIREILNDRFVELCSVLEEAVKGVNPTGPFERAAALADQSGYYSFGGRAGGPEPWPAASEVEPIDLQTLSSAESDEITLALVPVKHPSDVPMALGFGGWNECPMPELLSGALREWNATYQAVPVCVTDSVIECIVDRPPQSENECLALAAQQWVLCEDIVSQGTQSIRGLAFEIRNAKSWFFWWD